MTALLALSQRNDDAGPRGVRRLHAAWEEFAARFVMPDGRVVDTGNAGISHSEGQGLGMLLALQADDRARFGAIAAWTRRHLRRRGDALHAWHWSPATGQVMDDNNASDGDLFVAAALITAGQAWSRPDWVAEGRQVAADLLRLCIRRVAGRTLLLPGARGFERTDETVVNPSYYALPLLRLVARGSPDSAWLPLAVDGVRLLRDACLGPWGLPADWVAVPHDGGPVTAASGWPARFSYDAVRVPLWLAWAGLPDEPGCSGPAQFWSTHWGRGGSVPVPAWVELHGGPVAPHPASPGIVAVAQFVTGSRGEGRFAPPVEHPDYYSAVLSLLAMVAAAETGRPHP
ncbi:glycosyl hydrolase family 5 [Roseomonas sp. OT10]|uniref:glycosyl hydrolase family 8 n=1 Tax=Roseomonas cutis TaxID=2897332 RepID=UPI001E53C3E2|nr:glycosyl hydrolase family 8 [Roseomonas sp. OT10]UFN47308.1 glycosyl hydrolase family 5 [Roseomonas sp. OT10]